MLLNLLESRVLEAVRLLGSPTTLEVAEHCTIPGRKALAILHDLEVADQIQASGRRWTVPSQALQPPSVYQSMEDLEQTGPGYPDVPSAGCRWSALVVLVLFFALAGYGLCALIGRWL
jgi:hypothetical protein